MKKTQDSNKPRIAITLGDPAGIGPEIVARVVAMPRMRRMARFVVVGNREILDAAAEICRIRRWREVCARTEFDEPVRLRSRVPRPGKWSARTGRMSLAWVRRAVELCLRGETLAMVTAPICKQAWQKAGCEFPGHTEFVASMCGNKAPVMMLAGGGLRVALATIHEPLAKVPRLLTVEKIKKTCAILAHDLTVRFGIIRPRIAVLGLNPHAGEGGVLGSEDQRIILPAVKALQRRRIDACGPLPADTAFHHALRGAYDAVLAMYHDQGLAPLKTVAFDTGVNITLGLPVIRTSPDHGTGFDIAGRNSANPDSMVEAVRVAMKMVVRDRLVMRCQR